MLKPPVPLVPCVVLVSFLAACWGGTTGGDCSSQWCADRLDIKITRFDKDEFPAGSYFFSFTPVGDSPIEINCGLNGDGNLVCDEAANLDELSLNGSSTEFTARFSIAPTSMYMEVDYEDRLLGETTLSPEYTTVMPNGPECELICFQASVSMEVSAP